MLSILKIARSCSQKTVVTDTIRFKYETRKWNKPAVIKIVKTVQENENVKVEVQLVDENNVRHLDATNYFEYALAGDGELIKNQEISTASSKVQAFNGRGGHQYKAQ